MISVCDFHELTQTTDFQTIKGGKKISYENPPNLLLLMYLISVAWDFSSREFYGL